MVTLSTMKRLCSVDVIIKQKLKDLTEKVSWKNQNQLLRLSRQRMCQLSSLNTANANKSTVRMNHYKIMYLTNHIKFKLDWIHIYWNTKLWIFTPVWRCRNFKIWSWSSPKLQVGKPWWVLAVEPVQPSGNALGWQAEGPQLNSTSALLSL